MTKNKTSNAPKELSYLLKDIYSGLGYPEIKHCHHLEAAAKIAGSPTYREALRALSADSPQRIAEEGGKD